MKNHPTTDTPLVSPDAAADTGLLPPASPLPPAAPLPLDVWQLNQAAWARLVAAEPHWSEWSVTRHEIGGSLVFDFRSPTCPPAAGQLLAAVSAGDGLEVSLEADTQDSKTQDSKTQGPDMQGPDKRNLVRVRSSQPVAACLGAQYAGWPLNCPPYFAMVSGPVRGLRGREPLFQHFQRDLTGLVSRPAAKWIAVLESDKLPPPAAIQQMAEECQCPAQQLVLCVAGTATPAGTLQVVARSLETALHQIESLHGPLPLIRGGHGQAPLPPVAPDSLTAIGWTNDAIIYAGEVCLQVDGDWPSLQAWGAQLPSHCSPSFGQPFLELFRAANHDFYRLDPRLFSPAVVRLEHLASGQSATFGQLRPDLFHSFLGNH